MLSRLKQPFFNLDSGNYINLFLLCFAIYILMREHKVQDFYADQTSLQPESCVKFSVAQGHKNTNHCTC